MKKISLSVLLMLFIGTLARAGQADAADRYFTPWMNSAQSDAYMTMLGAKDADGKNYWDHRHWVENIEVRLNNGVFEQRYRIGEPPETGGYWWYWWVHIPAADQDSFAADMKAKKMTLVHLSTYREPDGGLYYYSVWHRVTSGNNADLTCPIPPPPLPGAKPDPAAAQVSSEKHRIEIGDSSLTLDGDIVSLSDLRARLRQKADPNSQLEIAPTKGTSYELISAVLDEVKRAGLVHVVVLKP